MRFQNPLVFCLLFVVTLFFHKKNSFQTSNETKESSSYLLTVERGAFHYDCFELTPNMIKYYPSKDSQLEVEKYNTLSEVALDSTETQKFFNEIIEDGFWNLKNNYTESSSDTSQLKITLSVKGKTKSIICEDFERGCHELVKSIEDKIVELEGNNLKRIYLPG